MFEPEVILGIVDKTVNNNAVFGDLLSPENKTTLINKSLIRTAEVGEILCQQGQYNNTLFLIISGGVEIFAVASGKTTSLGSLGAGELVGEISSLFMMPCIATVKVIKPSVVLEISCDVFSSMLSSRPEIQHVFNKRCRNRIIETTLRCVPIFDGLDKQSFSELCYISSIETVKKNHIIAHEGKMEKSMYVIGGGTARVYITFDGKEITIALLQSGDYFGEYSLLTGDSRCASVAALTDMHLLSLEGEAFESFIDYNEETEGQITQLSIDRKQSLDQMRDNLVTRYAVESQLGHIQNRLGM